MKIRSFNKGDFRPFTKKAFENWHKSKTLILDLRDNGGGRLNEIVDLYSYLADSTCVFGQIWGSFQIKFNGRRLF
jgi:C-terminal processing protease CtpA/Prc